MSCINFSDITLNANTFRGNGIAQFPIGLVPDSTFDINKGGNYIRYVYVSDALPIKEAGVIASFFGAQSAPSENVSCAQYGIQIFVSFSSRMFYRICNTSWRGWVEVAKLTDIPSLQSVMAA